MKGGVSAWQWIGGCTDTDFAGRLQKSLLQTGIAILQTGIAIQQVLSVGVDIPQVSTAGRGQNSCHVPSSDSATAMLRDGAGRLPEPCAG